MPSRIVLSCIALSLYAFASSQVTYQTEQGNPVVKFRTVDLRTMQEPEAYVEYREQPEPGGDAYTHFLKKQKEKAMALFPEKKGSLGPAHSAVMPPEVVRGFTGNGFYGIPLDNHLAVNRNDLVVSVVNTHLLVTGPTGIWQKAYSLDDFWSALGETNNYFDPRIIYDPLENRFVLAMMQDFDCGGSNIVFAFSVTDDPTGEWNLYQFEGCPESNGTFADFPMLALSHDELFFTYNAVYQDSTWQTGFNETLIYQINKFDGYTGQNLRWRSWSDIKNDGTKLRYICPVKYGDENMASDLYFLSDRSFDIQNDTIFLLHINGNQDAGNLNLSVEPLISDQTYGVPPNARQPMDYLQTNDARVLDAFYAEDQVQFVGNTMDTATGRCAVYHGVITNPSGAPQLHAAILSNGTENFAYPGIAYTGANPGEHDAIIIASHSSMDRYPGYSALYYNEGYSEWVTVKEGSRNIDMFKINNPYGVDPTLERWGDYSGIQRQYNEVGTVYTASSYGKPGSVNDTWEAYLRRPEEAAATSDIGQSDALKTFPNPANDWITIDLDMDIQGKVLTAVLFDLNGKMIRTVFNKTVGGPGPLRFHYNSASLEPGVYVLSVAADGVQVGRQRIVIQ